MKKCGKQDGYVLAYVMVVILVFAAVIATCFSSAERNYKAQIAAEQRMQERYAAEGIVEKALARLQKEDPGDPASWTESDYTVSIQEISPDAEGNSVYKVTVLSNGSGGSGIEAEITVSKTEDPEGGAEVRSAAYISYRSLPAAGGGTP